MLMKLVNRALAPAVALETTLLVHGVPKADGPALAQRLAAAVKAKGANAAVVGVVGGVPTVGMNGEELAAMFAAPKVEKVNASNLGVAIHRKVHAATTVSTTMELAARAGVKVFATGGLGGVHKGFGTHADISADLVALTRFPVAVVTSGVKSLLDVAATREVLETLGIPVVGWRVSEFPAFYLSKLEGVGKVDVRFDEMSELARYVEMEVGRTGRGVVVCNAVPAAFEIAGGDFAAWLLKAERAVDEAGVTGRDRTPRILGELHQVSGGATLRANVELAVSNAEVAAELASEMRRSPITAEFS